MPTKSFVFLLSVVLLGSSTFANTHTHWNPSGHSRSQSTKTRAKHSSSKTPHVRNSTRKGPSH